MVTVGLVVVGVESGMLFDCGRGLMVGLDVFYLGIIYLGMRVCMRCDVCCGEGGVGRWGG